jgi:hypothetical protein
MSSKSERAAELLRNVATYRDTPAGAALAEAEPEAALQTIFVAAEGLGKTDGCAGRWFAAQLEQFATSWRDRLSAADALDVILNLARRTQERA